jgi:hypothetical protein
MEIWKILIYPLGIILGGFEGILLTALIYYLICRFLKKETIDLPSILRLIITTRLVIIFSPILAVFSHKKQQPSPRLEVQNLTENSIKQPTMPAQQIEEQIPIQTTEEPSIEPRLLDQDLEIFITKLLKEFEGNINKARRFSGDNLIPLETKIWDTSQYLINSFPGGLREEAEGVYDSIKALNSLVWFATEFQRRSPSISEQYTNLLNTIAGRLTELIRNPLLASFHDGSDYQAVVTTTSAIAATP